jgi:hypothetical protein
MHGEVFGCFFFAHGWVVETPSGYAFSGRVTYDSHQEQAKTWDSQREAQLAIEDAGIEGEIGVDYEIVTLAVVAR